MWFLELEFCENVSWKFSGNLVEICLVGFVDTLSMVLSDWLQMYESGGVPEVRVNPNHQTAAAFLHGILLLSGHVHSRMPVFMRGCLLTHMHVKDWYSVVLDQTQWPSAMCARVFLGVVFREMGHADQSKCSTMFERETLTDAACM